MLIVRGVGSSFLGAGDYVSLDQLQLKGSFNSQKIGIRTILIQVLGLGV